MIKIFIIIFLIFGIYISNAQDFLTGKLLNVGFSSTITEQPWGNNAFDRNFGQNHFTSAWNN